MRQVWGTQLLVGIIFIAASFPQKGLCFVKELNIIQLSIDNGGQKARVFSTNALICIMALAKGTFSGSLFPFSTILYAIFIKKALLLNKKWYILLAAKKIFLFPIGYIVTYGNSFFSLPQVFPKHCVLCKNWKR